MITTTEQNQMIFDKISGLVLGEEGVVVIFSHPDGVIIASQGIIKDDVPMVIREALRVSEEPK